MDKMNQMKLFGMAKAMYDWAQQPKHADVAPADFAGILVDAEWIARENRKLQTRLRCAKFREPGACVEDIDYAHTRGLAKSVMLELSTCHWAHSHQNIILTGYTGVGKSYLACALGQKACREGFSVIYRRLSRLFDELTQARADGAYPHLLSRLAKTQVLILDDFGTEPLSAAQRKEMLEVLDDRYKVSSTIVTSQLDPKDWHPVIGDPTLADAILDRLVHNAHRIKLGGDSVRKTEGLTTEKKKAK
jgi:DNA replication protein DnaC